jgi:phosphoenolpyruvate carboxykinase (ATP)
MNLIENPSFEELREMAKWEEKTTIYGNASYVSKIRSRSAKFTEIIYDEPNEVQREIIKNVDDYLKDKEVIMLDRTMCVNPEYKLACKFYVTKKFARIAYMWGSLLFEPEKSNPDMVVIDVPEWPERKVLVDAKNLKTYVLGTDYTGEIKKAFLRMGMYVAKTRKGRLGLHAGSKVIKVIDKDGVLKEKGAIFFGLSGTGKTTLTCHDHFLTPPEGVIIRQDDIVFLGRDSSCIGTECNFYIKTEGLEPVNQKVLYNALISPRAILENVYVNDDGTLDLENFEFSSNGRAVVFRSDMYIADDKIDLPSLSILVFITRRDDIVPPIARLNPLQAAAFFMLGESIETSAGDPTQAGKSKRVVGTNPFIVGSEALEGNIFYDIIKDLPGVECFIMNTGHIGGVNGEKIKVKDSTEILKQIAKGGISWSKDPFWGYEVPSNVQGLDYSRFDLKRFYSDREILEMNKKLLQERIDWLNRFPDLNPQIKKVFG